MQFDLCKKIIENVSHVIVGKEHSIELLLIALLADGHVLIDGHDIRDVTLESWGAVRFHEFLQQRMRAIHGLSGNAQVVFKRLRRTLVSASARSRMRVTS